MANILEVVFYTNNEERGKWGGKAYKPIAKKNIT